jgi:hypothetical protein
MRTLCRQAPLLDKVVMDNQLMKTVLGIVSDLFDPNEGLLFALLAPADLTASLPITIVPRGPTSIPEPGTVVLLGSGLLGLPGYRCRRHLTRR